jgi:hypothetical protein
VAGIHPVPAVCVCVCVMAEGGMQGNVDWCALGSRQLFGRLMATVHS